MSTHPYTRLFPKVVAPTVSDDGTLGYEVGDVWVDTAHSKTYQAFDISTGAASWLELTGGSSGFTQEEIEDFIGAMVSGNTETGIAVTYDDAGGKLNFDAQTAGDLRYAPIAKGVTNGDTHDHVGGDGAQIDHGGTGGLSDDDHTQYHTDARGDARYPRFGPFALTNDITPAQLTSATYSDYDATGLSTADVVRLDSDHNGIIINGIVGGSDGRILILHNINTLTYTIWLRSDVGSTAINQFHFANGGDVGLPPGGMIALQYDATLQRWVGLDHGASSLVGVPINPGLLTTVFDGRALIWDDANGWFTITAMDHGNLASIGTNTHAEIDTHIASTSNPHSVTADQVAAIPNSGWIAITDTWTRTGNFTFTISGDLTATYRKGIKVRYKDGGGYEYGIVVASSFGGGNTTVTLATNSNYAMAAATITDRYISNVENPDGWPMFFDYTVTWSRSGTAFTNPPTIDAAKFRVVGNQLIGIINFTMPAAAGGTGEVYASVPVTIVTDAPSFGWEYAATAGFCLCAAMASIGKLNFYKSGAVPIDVTNGYKYAFEFKYLF